MFGRGECGLLNSLGHVVVTFLAGSETELLSLVVEAKALGVLVKAREASRLLVRFDALHLDDLGSGEYVGELDRCTTFFLVLNNFTDAFFNRVALCGHLIVKISLKSILIAL